MASSSHEIADQLSLIADELDSAASAVSSIMIGRSRELRAWATRIRRQVELLRHELDLDSETKSQDAVGAARRAGLTFSQKALLVLATVSGLADAPSAIETSRDIVNAAVEAVEDLIGEGQSTEPDGVVVSESEHEQREAVEPFEQWLSLTDRQPLRRIGEYQTGKCVLSPGAAIDPAATQTFPELPFGDSIRVEIKMNEAAPFMFLDKYSGAASGPTAEQIVGHGSGWYLARVRCLGARSLKTQKGYDQAAWVDEVAQTLFLVEEVEFVSAVDDHS